MPSADQVPIESPHSRMHGGKWVVLIAGSTGSALRVVGPPNLHITSDVRRDPLCRIAQAILAILLASAMAAIWLAAEPIAARVMRSRCLGRSGAAIIGQRQFNPPPESNNFARACS